MLREIRPVHCPEDYLDYYGTLVPDSVACCAAHTCAQKWATSCVLTGIDPARITGLSTGLMLVWWPGGAGSEMLIRP